MDIILAIMEAIANNWAILLIATVGALVIGIILWSIVYYYVVSERNWRHAIRNGIRTQINLIGIIMAFLMVVMILESMQLGDAAILVNLGAMVALAGGIYCWRRCKS